MERTFKPIKLICSGIIASVMAVFICSEVFACTGVYIGKDVSTDGSYIFARSNDSQGVHPNRMEIVPAKDIPNRTMAIGDINKTYVDLPTHTYKYTGTPFMSYMVGDGEAVNYDFAVSSNDQGVGMTSSVTAFSNKKAIKADPYEESGISEDGLVQLIMGQAGSAKEGVKLIASYIDEYGLANYAETVLIADQDEAWYMELYTGHQYAAVKLPDDQVAVYGNEFSLQYLSDYEDSIVSDDLEKLPKSKGFAVYGDNDELNLFMTYAGKETLESYSHRRTWIGHEILAKKKYGDFELDEIYDFTYEPAKKVSAADVMKLMRNRFSGTKYSPDENDIYDSRVIGTEATMSAHVLQVFPDVPKEIAGVTWECTGPAVCGVFVPLSNACTSVSEAYGREQSAGDAYDMDPDNYPYYASKETTSIAVKDFKTYAEPIQEYWFEAEEKMEASYADTLKECAGKYEKNPEEAAEIMTEYCNKMQENAFSDQKAILKDLMYRFCEDSNCLQLGYNPETDEYLPEKRVLDPLEIDLDAAKYE